MSHVSASETDCTDEEIKFEIWERGLGEAPSPEHKLPKKKQVSPSTHRMRLSTENTFSALLDLTSWMNAARRLR